MWHLICKNKDFSEKNSKKIIPTWERNADKIWKLLLSEINSSNENYISIWDPFTIQNKIQIQNTFCFNLINVLTPQEKSLQNKSAFCFLSYPYYDIKTQDNIFQINWRPLYYQWYYYFLVYEINKPISDFKQEYQSLNTTSVTLAPFLLDKIYWWKLVFYRFSIKKKLPDIDLKKISNINNDNNNEEENSFWKLDKYLSYFKNDNDISSYFQYIDSVDINIPDFQKHHINDSLQNFFFAFQSIKCSKIYKQLSWKEKNNYYQPFENLTKYLNKQEIGFILQIPSEEHIYNNFKNYIKNIKKEIKSLDVSSYLKKDNINVWKQISVNNKSLFMMMIKQKNKTHFFDITQFIQINTTQFNHFLKAKVFACNKNNTKIALSLCSLFEDKFSSNLNDFCYIIDILIENQNITKQSESKLIWYIKDLFELNQYWCYSKSLQYFQINIKEDKINVKINWKSHSHQNSKLTNTSDNNWYLLIINPFNTLLMVHEAENNQNIYWKTMLFNNTFHLIDKSKLNKAMYIKDVQSKELIHYKRKNEWTYLTPYETWLFQHLFSYKTVASVANVFYKRQAFIWDMWWYSWTLNQKGKYWTCYSSLFVKEI